MATLYHYPYFLSLSSDKFFLYQEEYKIISHTHHYPPRKNFNFCICSAKKSRGVGKKVKSNVELCNDIKEFVSAVGLPKGHVPSIKELSDHGRNDLAYIVRRRGYKLMRELLSNSMEVEIDGSNIENEGRDTIINGGEISSEGQDEKVEDVIEEGSLSTEVPIQDHSGIACMNHETHSSDNSGMPIESSIDVSLNEVESMNEENSSSLSYDIDKQDDKVQHGVEEISLPTISENVEQHDRGILSPAEDKSLSTEVLIMDNSLSILNGSSGSSSNIETPMPVETLANLSSEEKTDEKVNSIADDMYLRTEASELEYLTNYGSIALGPNSSSSSCISIDPATNSSLEDKVAKFIQSGNLDAIEDNVYGMLEKSAGESEGFNEPENESEIQSKIPSEDNDNHAVNRSNAPSALNGSISLSKNANLPMRVDDPVRNDDLPDESLASSDLDKDLDVEASKGTNEVEINHLKFMLHQKELELSHLKEQIEKKKFALSNLQNKAEMEIRKAQELISEKEAELLAAEESLSGLVEVKIQYNVDGESVEVAGSFNGWHNRIKMDPQPSSSITDHAGSRTSKLWSTMLWLYPGVYEIKFIVDGQWTIDPKGEMITRGGICNNVLRVVG